MTASLLLKAGSKVMLVKGVLPDWVLDQVKDGSGLHFAAEEGNVNSVEEQLSRGVLVDSVDKTGRTALMIAAESGRHAVIEVE